VKCDREGCLGVQGAECNDKSVSGSHDAPRDEFSVISGTGGEAKGYYGGPTTKAIVGEPEPWPSMGAERDAFEAHKKANPLPKKQYIRASEVVADRTANLKPRRIDVGDVVEVTHDTDHVDGTVTAAHEVGRVERLYTVPGTKGRPDRLRVVVGFSDYDNGNHVIREFSPIALRIVSAEYAEPEPTAEPRPWAGLDAWLSTEAYGAMFGLDRSKLPDGYTETPKAPDMVNHPPHYVSPSGIECIDVVEHLSFCRGNAIKYLWRAGQKGDAIEDLRKAIFYVNREISRLEKMK